MCSPPQLDPGAEEARKGSELGEVAVDPLQILRLSVLGVRGVKDDPEAGVGCAVPDVDFDVEGAGHRFPAVHYTLLLHLLTKCRVRNCFVRSKPNAMHVDTEQ